MSTRVKISYKSPANDPFKVPRPHYYELDSTLSDKSPLCTGGEVGEVRLLGFCPSPLPDVDNWVIVYADEYRVVQNAEPGEQWFAQFVSVGDGKMFGYEIPIESVSVVG